MMKNEAHGDAEDYTESDDEGADGYRKGGYHPVHVGEIYNGRYHVLAKLGWGHFSTVWLCQDLSATRYVAMKVQKSAPHYTEAAYDEIELLAEAAKRSKDAAWEETQKGPLRELFPDGGEGFTGVVQLIDYFEHFGVNGKHVCMVFETMGPNVLALIKRYNFKGIPVDIVRKVTTHTLIGLDYLHRVCGIIHTDLKPENVLVGCPRGVPVNKTGVPLVGNVDPAAVAANFKKDTSAKSEEKKGKKKDKKFDEEGSDVEDEAAPRPPPMLVHDPMQTAPPEPIEPPYMKPFLKPSRSDPTLLSSYGDDSIALNRPLYNHAGSLMKVPPPGVPVPAPMPPSSSSGVAKPESIDEKLIEEVLGLDLFDHDGVTYKVADLGNACWVERHFSDDIQTRQYRSPETIINAGYDTSADIWSLACMVFELATGDYLFDPKASDEYPRDEDHLALFIELLGPMPKDLISRGRRSSTYFNRRGELRHIKSLRYWPLAEVLLQKYHMHAIEAKSLASFLLPMLQLLPEDRISAKAALEHPWSLVILDECHQATGRHPMAETIRIVKKLEQELRPRILGLTASFYAGKLKRKRDSEEGRLELELLLDASLFCPDVPNGKQQEFKHVTWSEDVTSSEAFEAAFLKEVQVVQQLGQQSLEVYVKSWTQKCVVRQLKQHCEELQQIQQLPVVEERSNVEKLLQKLPLLQELTSQFYSHFTTRPCLTRAPKISAKVEKLSHIILKEQDEGGTGGSKGIVFVEQVCVTEPLAVALSRLGVTAEAVYGMLPKKDLDAILKRFKDPWLRLRQRNFQILLESYLHFIQPSLQLFTFSFMSLAGECWHISGSNCPLP
ncbi:unnamed protein product [Cladocopium goreaui]|uniref:non-specific serine/threonine protein kinase n=1 Tax=Cladocopium goreaui TaxID=2562237 RepID=A0A9P1DBW0_9DINO|nr:unnamed protein product [Cladocopium goreaui]